MKKWGDLIAAVIFGAALLFGVGAANSGEAAPAPRAHHERHVSHERNHHSGQHHVRYEKHHNGHSHGRYEDHRRLHHNPGREVRPISYHGPHRHHTSSGANFTVMFDL